MQRRLTSIMLTLKNIKNSINLIDADYISHDTENTGHVTVDLSLQEIKNYTFSQSVPPIRDMGMALKYLLSYAKNNDKFNEKTYTWY